MYIAINSHTFTTLFVKRTIDLLYLKKNPTGTCSIRTDKYYKYNMLINISRDSGIFSNEK